MKTFFPSGRHPKTNHVLIACAIYSPDFTVILSQNIIIQWCSVGLSTELSTQPNHNGSTQYLLG